MQFSQPQARFRRGGGGGVGLRRIRRARGLSHSAIRLDWQFVFFVFFGHLVCLFVCSFSSMECADRNQPYIRSKSFAGLWTCHFPEGLFQTIVGTSPLVSAGRNYLACIVGWIMFGVVKMKELYTCVRCRVMCVFTRVNNRPWTPIDPSRGSWRGPFLRGWVRSCGLSSPMMRR